MKTRLLSVVLLGIFAAFCQTAKADYIDPCPIDGALWGDGRTINCTASAPRNIDTTPGNIQKFSVTATLLDPQSTLTINTTTGSVIDADVFLRDIDLDFFYVLRQGGGEILLMSNLPGGGSGAWIDFRLDADSLLNYAGGSFSATEGPGLPNVAGTIAPVDAPETATWTLLLAGVAALCFAKIRTFRLPAC